MRWAPVRLDDLDDRHHRTQPHPGTAFGILRALHDRAGGPGCSSVSVAPLGSEELLFANKLYRLWFGTQATGHLQLVEQAGMPEQRLSDDGLDDMDGLAGLPTGTLTTARPENAEIYVAQGQMAGGPLALPELGRRPPGADGDRHRHHAPAARPKSCPRHRPSAPIPPAAHHHGRKWPPAWPTN